MRCRNPAKIKYTRNMFVKHMSAKDLRYLNSINNEEQYPGAKCAMVDEGIYTYQQSASSAVESMNATNKEMQACTAVDTLNATLLLIRLECNRFQQMKQEAWGDDSGLTPRRKDEYDSTYTDLFSHHYSYNVTNVETHWQVRVQCNNVERAEPQYVRFRKEAVNGSFFGTCTCGADKTDAVPCEHMAAVALSSCLHPQITPISIMPFWWGREQWRKQFPSDLYCDGSTTMNLSRMGKFRISLYVTARIGLHRTKVDVQRRQSGVNLALKRQWLKQRAKRSHPK
jgi:hypothetical protein